MTQFRKQLQEYRLKDRIIYVLAGLFCCFFTPVVAFSEDYHICKHCPPRR